MDGYITKNIERNSVNIDTCSEQPSFLEWLLQRHNTSPILHRDLCKKTARFGNGSKEFESSMEWFRRRYRREMEERKQLIESNPFKEE